MDSKKNGRKEMAKDTKYMVEKAWLFADKIRVRFFIKGSADTVDMTFDYNEHPDVRSNMEALASFLNDKLDSVLGG